MDESVDHSDETASADAPAQRMRVEAVERSLKLMQCFRLPGETLSLAQLAQRSGFYKSTILRLTASLIHMDFMRRDARGHYALGGELRRLGALSDAEMGLESLIRPVLSELSYATMETASFYIRDGMERACLFRVNSPRSARHHLTEGSRHPVHTGAAGKVLCAFDPHLGTGKAHALTRSRGWAVALGERDPDLAAIAVPVFNARDELLGAMAVSGLLTRFTPEDTKAFRERLLAATQALRPLLPPRSTLPDGGGP